MKIPSDDDIEKGLAQLAYFDDGRRDLMVKLGLFHPPADTATADRVFDLTFARVFGHITDDELYAGLRAVVATATYEPPLVVE